jgi:vitamin B12 transporter
MNQPIRAVSAQQPLANFRTPAAPLRVTLTLLLLASAIHAPTPSQAQTSDIRPVKPDPAGSDRLDPVNVTATRMPTRVDETVAETTLLNRADIERATGRTLSEFLAQQPGMQSTSNGGLGQYSSLFIRGLDARHTLLLVDGMRLGSATVGVPSLDNLPLELIDRIEIVRGPLSSVYGSDPAGGVIQVFTRRSREGLTPNASLTLGSNRYRQLSAGLAFGQGAFDGAFQVVQTGTNSFSATNPNVLYDAYNPDTDPFRQTAGNLRLGWQLSQDWRIDASALQSNGLVRYDDGPGVDSRARLRNGVQTLSAAGRVSANWSTRLSYGHSTDVYETIDSFYGPYGAVKTAQQQFAWENTIPTPIGTLLALVERIEQTVSQPETTYAVDRRTIDAVGLGISGERAAHAWQAAIRQDRNSQFGNQNTGSVGYAFAFTPGWRAGLSYGTSFIAPSFNQLYYPGFGNPDLQPEEGTHGEVHLRWTSGPHSLRAAWVDNRIQGYIPSGPKPANVPNTRIDGLVASYEGRFSGVLLGASYEHLDPRNTTDGDDYGKLLPRRAKDAFRARADWDLGTYRLGATVSAFSHRFDDAANALRLAGFATVDLRADWLISRDLTLGIRLNNLADKVYETAYGYNQPGREGYVTLRWAPR